ncbi:MAG: 2,3-bisphosphoglycerate-independent phosphoglycerate mutase [Alphaproteobacteria bacterium]
MRKIPRPVVLCILDGWGWRSESKDNAIAQAHTPIWDRLVKTCPFTLLDTSGLEVGLPSGQMGNSEVGHMNIGAGRIVMQDLPRIDAALADGSLAHTSTFTQFITKMKKSGGAAHIMGLLSPGGVHAHQDHIAALAKLIADAGVPVRIHAILDGRDTPPVSAARFLEKFHTATADNKSITLATLSGRYYAMDRDQRWERISLAYAAMVTGEGEKALNDRAALTAATGRKETDEFVKPTVLGSYTGMHDGDGVVMANFRADRAREILDSLLDPNFTGFKPDRKIHFAATMGMVEYSSKLNTFMPALFPANPVINSLGEIVAKAGRRQLRIAETEKYAHVTFFFNGGEERLFEGEERILVPSPKVATYDLKPEMSAIEVTDKLVKAIADETFDLIVINYANGDMVGHTGILSAAIKAAETIDTCLGRLEKALANVGGCMFITADHGNCEEMFDPTTDQPHTQHTLNKVPGVLVGAPTTIKALASGRLADIAPTLLSLMDLPQPAAMTGHSLLRETEIAAASHTHAAE